MEHEDYPYNSNGKWQTVWVVSQDKFWFLFKDSKSAVNYYRDRHNQSNIIEKIKLPKNKLFFLFEWSNKKKDKKVFILRESEYFDLIQDVKDQINKKRQAKIRLEKANKTRKEVILLKEPD